MECKRCACCGQQFRPRPQVPAQTFCPATKCQRERKRRWQKAKRASDPDYRLNQARASRAWAASHREYWRAWRLAHPDYCERNRVNQQERDHRRGRVDLAKMDAWTRESPFPSGTYRLLPAADGDLAKMDAWMVEITLLSKHSSASGNVLPSCKETTR